MISLPLTTDELLHKIFNTEHYVHDNDEKGE